jgi:hypothetical protein
MWCISSKSYAAKGIAAFCWVTIIFMICLIGILNLELLYPSSWPLLASGKSLVMPVAVGGSTDVHDFSLYYASGCLNVLRLTKYPDIDVYDPNLLSYYVSQPLAPFRSNHRFILEYPPFFIGILTPLTSVRIADAWLIWFVLGCIAFAFAIALLFWGQPLNWMERFYFFVTSFGALTFFYNAKIGQTGAFIALFVSLFFVLLKRERNFLTGLSFALCMLKLQYAPAFGILGLLLGKLNFFKGALLSGLLILGFSIWSVGLQHVPTFLTNILIAESHTSSNYYGHIYIVMMDSFRGFLAYVGTPAVIVQILASTMVLVALAFIVYLWTYGFPYLKSRINWSFELCASISIILVLIFSMHCYSYDYLTETIPYIWLYVGLKTEKPIRLKQLFLLVALYMTPIIGWLAFAFGYFESAIPLHFLWSILLLATTFIAFGHLLFPALIPSLRRQAAGEMT